VNDSVRWISERLGLEPTLTYSGGERGWVGDSPFIFLDCSRMRALGWKPKLGIRQAVEKTVDYLTQNPDLLGAR
jgi:UDP-glucose 4-epimerase